MKTGGVFQFVYASTKHPQSVFRSVLRAYFWHYAGRTRKARGIDRRADRVKGLFIRLSVGFFSHPKTIRLYRIIGVDAFWLPPRIWAYAAQYQPDGDFSEYDVQELAMILGYQDDASRMLQALQSAKFMDGMRIHDWNDHNGYHVVFAKRARKAAEARWGKPSTSTNPSTSTKTSTKTKSKHCSSIAQALLQASTIYNAYPKKVARPTAIRAIQKALQKVPFDRLLELTEQYAEARNGDITFCPNPATWFNQERFNDDPETWVRQESLHLEIEKPKEPAPKGAAYRVWDHDE